MSEHLQTSAPTQEVDSSFLLEKLEHLVKGLDSQSGGFLLADKGQVRQNERLEHMSVEVPGRTCDVIRHRYSDRINLNDVRRERYYSIHDLGRPILLYMDVNLAEEDRLVTEGDFPAIASLHEKLARHTALGLADPEVKVGHSQDIHRFSLLIRDALHRQKVLHAAQQAS